MHRVTCLLVAIAAFAVHAQSPQTNTLSGLVRLLAQKEDALFHRDILRGMDEGLAGRRTVAMPEGWDSVAEKLARSPEAEVRELALALSVKFGSRRALESLRKTLVDQSADMAARTNALTTLVGVKDPELPPALRSLLNSAALRRPALRALAAYEDSQTPAAVLAIYPILPATEKNDALSTLSSRPAYARALLAAVEAKKLAGKDLTADIVRNLRGLKDPALDAKIAQIWGVTRETPADKVAEIARWKKVVSDQGFGDPRRGRAAYVKLCQQCHALFGEGGTVGPDITGHNRADLDYILQNIIDPNAIIPNDYRTWNVETKDDRSITGIVTRQDDKSVTIVTANESIVIPRNEVSSMSQSELSLMPEGLFQGLSEGEVRDLLGYLRGSAQVPLPPEN